MLYPLTFPKAPRTERLGLNRRQSATESTWTYQTQIVHTASQWVLEWTWPQMSHAEAERVAAWLLSLRGQEGTFRYFPRQTQASALTGVQVATTAFAFNTTLSAGGYAAGAASTLRVGQFMQVGEQLVRIVEAAAFADPAGHVTIAFEPELRSNIATGTAINFASPSGVFRLASSDALTFTLDPDRSPEFGTINAREVI